MAVKQIHSQWILNDRFEILIDVSIKLRLLHLSYLHLIQSVVKGEEPRRAVNHVRISGDWLS